MNMMNQVSNVRSYLRGLARKRNSGTVTADDIHMYWNRNHIRANLSQKLSVINTVFADSSFKRVAYVASNRQVARYRKISEYTVR